ncbi:MAG: dihydrolipoyl dehydrogenase [Candidatus Eisenbacteria bacterium]|uniref:Dihydrolipoyl dehydrogenase n=1 Tax=Eiseniibacteriota bacterium TaxID=2212470 RepID=A0A9D6L9Q6_UNCEI|nr:dihydrolipoyl dehydrogenase [Candidatus Eisenbacteria bacterium]
MSDDAFDLIVIGSGPGGYVAAIRAAQLGMKTAVVEKYPTLGGTCLNVGCIPSKALLDSSEHFAFARHGIAAHGVRATVELDLPTMLARKDRVVQELTRGVEGLFRKNKVTRLTGTGRIAAPGVVQVTGADGATEAHRAARILIATGSKPARLPGIAYDDRRIVHSTHALALPAVPETMIVIGAGAIGLELGSVWARLGAKVAVLEFQDRAVPGMDRKSGALLQRALEKQGLAFRFGASARGARVEGDRVRVTVVEKDAEREETCDVLLVAVGRRPYTDGLGARELGLATDAKGRIEVDASFATSVPGIFAIGDVIAGPMLAHKAEEEGIAAVERMAGMAGHVAYACIPNVVYTWPELASVGLSEEDAAAKGIVVAIGTFPFLANGRAKAMGERDGQVKIIADAATDRVLGANIVGPRASDLIAELATAMELGASAEDIARSVHAHPTLPEAVKEAALAVGKRAIHI